MKVEHISGIFLESISTKVESSGFHRMAEHGIVIRRDGAIVASLGYRLEDGWVVACGTWVDHRYRRMGLGTRLWMALASERRRPKVRAWAVTVGGMRLLTRCRRRRMFSRTDFAWAL